MKDRRGDFDLEEQEFLQLLKASPAAITGGWAAVCPPPELWRALAEGLLPEDLRQKAESHLASCRLCRHLARDFPQVEAETVPAGALERIRRDIRNVAVQTQNTKRGLSWLWLRPIGAVALVALIVLVVLVQKERETRSTLVQNTPAVAPSKGPELIALEKPAIKLPASMLVFRGGEKAGLAKDITPGLEAYSKDDFTGAINALEPLAGKYPHSPEVFFYLGVSELFANENAGAVRYLHSAKEMGSTDLKDDIGWYLLLAYQRSGDIAAAESERKEICGNPGPYSARACATKVQ